LHAAGVALGVVAGDLGDDPASVTGGVVAIGDGGVVVPDLGKAAERIVVAMRVLITDAGCGIAVDFLDPIAGKVVAVFGDPAGNAVAGVEIGDALQRAVGVVAVA